jgi:deazaflavin-dependent oxidoreductase (nitroreductase family)
MPTLRQLAASHPWIGRLLLRLQVFLLRHNLAGRLGQFAMVITTSGRKTGKPRSTPIDYVRDGESVLAFTLPHRHWYRNLRHRPDAVIVIRGERMDVRAEFVDDDAGRRRIIETYQRERPGMLARMHQLAADASIDAINEAAKSRAFVRFWPRSRGASGSA